MSPSLTLPRLALVDLDGTLVDTLPDMAYCVDETLTSLGLAPAGQERARKWVGDGIEALVRRALGGEPEAALQARALSIFSRLYAQHTSARSRTYDGVPAALDFFQSAGVELACVTNKAAVFTEKLLAELNLREYFSLVVSGDTLARKKPDPLPLLHAARHFGVSAAQSLLLGDSANDVRAARAAGMPVVCVSYGYNHGDDIRASMPDAVVDSLAELAEILVQPSRLDSAG